MSMFFFSTKEASKGFGCSEDAIRQSKSYNQHELTEGKHFIIIRNSNNAKKIMWSKCGITRLGFFIKSERAKQFRDWAEDYVIDGQVSNSEYQRIIMLQNEQIVQMDKDINRLKGILIKLHDSFHIQILKRLQVISIGGLQNEPYIKRMFFKTI